VTLNRYVLDANVLVSAVLSSNSTAYQAYQNALDTGILLASNQFCKKTALKISKFREFGATINKVRCTSLTHATRAAIALAIKRALKTIQQQQDKQNQPKPETRRFAKQDDDKNCRRRPYPPFMPPSQPLIHFETLSSFSKHINIIHDAQMIPNYPYKI
jgi:hypothetical protein